MGRIAPFYLNTDYADCTDILEVKGTSRREEMQINLQFNFVFVRRDSAEFKHI